MSESPGNTFRGKSSGLTNDDFRQILYTSKRQGSARPEPENESGHQMRSGQASFERVRKKSQVVEGKTLIEADPGGGAPLYRDRAEERRRGMHGPVDDAGPGQEVLGSPDGGDEHLHRIKGLDYELLNKARLLVAHKRSNIAGEDTQGDNNKQSACDRPTFHQSSLARSIVSALAAMDRSSHHPVQVENTSFVFSMRGIEKFEVPVLRTSAGRDAPSEGTWRESVTHSLPQSITREVCNILQNTSIRLDVDNRLDTERKETHESVVIAQENVDGREEEEDIFGDAGTDYVPERKTAKIESQAKSTYFSGIVNDGERDTTPSYYFSAAEIVASAHKRGKSTSNGPATIINDGYDECYPSYFDTGGDLEDSDDEGIQRHGEAKKDVELSRDKKKNRIKEKAKLDHELTSIQKMFDEKGYEHSAAFQKKTKKDNTATMRKKRRI